MFCLEIFADFRHCRASHTCEGIEHAVECGGLLQQHWRVLISNWPRRAKLLSIKSIVAFAGFKQRDTPIQLTPSIKKLTEDHNPDLRPSDCFNISSVLPNFGKS
jgi:hypothetical protein